MKRSGSLLQSYLTTEYRVYGAAPMERFTLRIGVRHPRLATLQHRTHAYCSAFITAWNPHSRIRSDTLNEAAQRRLMRDLRQLRCKVIRGEGVAADGRWKEPSLLALGLKRNAALRLARRYGQNAVVVCNKHGVPRLAILRLLS